MVALRKVTEAPSAFALAHRAFIDAGYPVVATEPGHKRPGSYMHGRWFPAAGWTAYATEPASGKTLAHMASWPGAGIGVVLGFRVGDSIVVALDFDTTDASELAALLACMPDTPMVKIGAKGETRFYRADPSIVSKSYKIAGRGILDLLAKGRQTVMPPTVHPHGMEYAWKDGCGLTVAAELPVFTAAHLAALEARLESLGWQSATDMVGDTSDAAGEPPRAANDDDDPARVYFRETNGAALANLSAWVPDLGLYKLQPKPDGYLAVATWRPSGTPEKTDEARERHLSIDRRGIKDWGDGPKGYSPIDLVMAATGRTACEATEFLRERLGLDDNVVFCTPATTVVPALEPHDPSPGANDNIDDRDFPEHLTHPPGLLGDMVEYIVDTSRRPSRALALGSALVTLGTIIGRRDATPTGSGTHLYVIALAPSGAGKDHPQDAGVLMLEDAVKAFSDDAEDNLVGAPDYMSSTAFLHELEDRPLRASFVDEFGKFLERVNSPKAAGFEAGIKKVMLEIWGKSFSAYRTPAWAGIASKRIPAPCYSVFGASTPTVFYNALQGDDRENGFLNRMLLLPSHAKPVLRDPKYPRDDIPMSLSEQLRDAYRIGRGLLPPGGIPEKRHIDWASDEAKALWDAFARECDESDLGGFCMRSAEMAGRLATIVAVGRQVESDRPTVFVEDIRWGIEVARWSAQRMAKDAGAYVADNPVGRDRARILAKLNAAPGKRVSQSDVMQDLGFKSADLNNHVRDMVFMGQLKTESVPPPGGGRAKVWLVAV